MEPYEDKICILRTFLAKVTKQGKISDLEESQVINRSSLVDSQEIFSGTMTAEFANRFSHQPRPIKYDTKEYILPHNEHEAHSRSHHSIEPRSHDLTNHHNAYNNTHVNVGTMVRDRNNMQNRPNTSRFDLLENNVKNINNQTQDRYRPRAKSANHTHTRATSCAKSNNSQTKR